VAGLADTFPDSLPAFQRMTKIGNLIESILAVRGASLEISRNTIDGTYHVVVRDERYDAVIPYRGVSLDALLTEALADLNGES
jgi:hypothetical protein